MTNKEPYTLKRLPDGTKAAFKNEAYWKDIAQKKYDVLLKRSEIPHFYWDISFNDYKGNKSIVELYQVKKYAKDCFTTKFDFVNLYLWSEINSSQKTALLCNIGKEAIKQGKKVKFILAGDLINYLIKNQGYSVDEDIRDKLNILKQQDMLLIDDIFDPKKAVQWKQSDLITAEIDLFFRGLLSTNIKVILSSNTNPLNIKDKFGIAIQELIDRNFIPLNFNDDIKLHRKKMFDNIFDEES